MRISSRLTSLGALAVLGAGLIAGHSFAAGPAFKAAQAATAATAPAIGFETPAVVDPIHTNGEPDLGIDSLGRVFSSGPTGTGTQRSTWYGSVDRGHTFRVINAGAPPSAITGLSSPPGGGDTDLAFDRSGKQYFSDLYALTCFRMATTSDGGATVAQNIYPGGCAGLPPADRQWFSVFDPPGATQSAYTGPRPLVYLEFNNVTSGGQWVKSTDGLTFVPAVAGNPDPVVYAPFGPDGHPAIDQLTGKVFQAAGSGNSLLLNIGTPNAAGDLTFLDAPSAANPSGDPSKLIHIADNLPASPDTLFSVVSLDSARNLVVAFCLGDPGGHPELRQVYVSAASAASGWTNWTRPVQVSSQVSVFPWVVAGGPGRADAVWYGSDKTVDPSSQSGQSWNVFMSQVVFPTDGSGAITGAAPATTQVKVTPHPMHYQDICLQGTACISSQGNRNLADFFEVTIDRTGAAEIVYDDTSNNLAQAGFTPDNKQFVDHAGGPVVTVARQSSGPGLYGTNVSGPGNAPVGGLRDVAGDALYPVIGGRNLPGMDILSSAMHLNGSTLTVTMQVADLTQPAVTAASVPGATNLQYLTRWQMQDPVNPLQQTIYYAGMETAASGQQQFYAGAARSVDLCSVSACNPHVVTYPEPGLGGVAEPGSVSCPAAPSAANPCTITINVRAADIGGVGTSSLLEEVGAYAFAASTPSGAITNPQALADSVPLQIDGVCCYNWNASAPPLPTTCHRAEGEGDIAGAKGGSAHFKFDQDGCEDGLPQSFTYSDPGAGVAFAALDTASATFDWAKHQMTLVGTGTDGAAVVTYTLIAIASDGVTPGVFNLTLSDGYSNVQSITTTVMDIQ